MAIDTGTAGIYDRLNQYDAYLRDKILGGKGKMIPKAQGFIAGTSELTGALGRGIRPGLRHVGIGLRESIGVGYMHAGAKHYTRRMKGEFAGKVGARTKSALGVMARGLGPGFVIWGASESEHGFGIGAAEQIAGFTAWGFGGSMGMQLGGWAGGGAMRAAGSGLSKVPGVKKLATTAMGKAVGRSATAAGALLGGPLGWLIGGLVAFETATWGVGMALHTLPTFAKQFKSDMNMSGYGGDYADSAGAITMRQRSLQVMGKSFVNARSALGQEGALLHA